MIRNSNGDIIELPTAYDLTMKGAAKREFSLPPLSKTSKSARTGVKNRYSLGYSDEFSVKVRAKEIKEEATTFAARQVVLNVRKLFLGR